MKKENRHLDGHKLHKIYTVALPAWKEVFNLNVALGLKRSIAVLEADMVVRDAMERSPSLEAKAVKNSFFVPVRDGLENGANTMPQKDFLKKIAEQSAENLVRAGMKTRVFCQASFCKL